MIAFCRWVLQRWLSDFMVDTYVLQVANYLDVPFDVSVEMNVIAGKETAVLKKASTERKLQKKVATCLGYTARTILSWIGSIIYVVLVVIFAWQLERNYYEV